MFHFHLIDERTYRNKKKTSDSDEKQGKREGFCRNCPKILILALDSWCKMHIIAVRASKKHIEPSKIERTQKSGNRHKKDLLHNPGKALDTDKQIVYTNQSKVLHHKLRREA